MDTPFDVWFDQIDTTLDLAFTDELLSDWNPMHPEEASPPISPPPPEKLTQITCQTDLIMYKEHETPQTVIAPSKPREENTHSSTVTKESGREMNQRILHYLQCPLLTKAEEDYFMINYGMMRRQVKTGFNNRRQRIIAPMHSMKQNDF
jgi:hypothetical protein